MEVAGIRCILHLPREAEQLHCAAYQIWRKAKVGKQHFLSQVILNFALLDGKIPSNTRPNRAPLRLSHRSRNTGGVREIKIIPARHCHEAAQGIQKYKCIQRPSYIFLQTGFPFRRSQISIPQHSLKDVSIQTSSLITCLGYLFHVSFCSCKSTRQPGSSRRGFE